MAAKPLLKPSDGSNNKRMKPPQQRAFLLP